MKKIYNSPMTECFHVNVEAVMAAASIQEAGTGLKATNFGTLETSDGDGSEDLAKGGSLWD